MKSSGKKVFQDMRQPVSNDPSAVKITFPCDYPIKVVGDAADDFAAAVCQVVVVHSPEFDPNTVVVVNSRNGRFQSVRLTIQATSEEQLKRLFIDLKATGRVHMVL